MKYRNYDWLSLIEYNNDRVEFLKYQQKHKGISINRCARAFCMKKKYVKWFIFDSSFMNYMESEPES